MSWELEGMTIDDAKEKFGKNKWPAWLYLALFFLPAALTFVVMRYGLALEPLFSGIVSLAIMNASINSVIAYITIRLDDKSSESLQHLEFINKEMDKLEGTLEEANDKVTGFTADLDEAKDVFRKVGVDLTQLDLDSVSDVVEKLKENREGLGEVLDNLKTVEVTEYIDQAKRINWKQLLSAAEEIMGFIQARTQESIPAPLTLDTSNISLTPPQEELTLPDDDEDLDWLEHATPNNEVDYSLMGEEEPTRTINIPKPKPRLKRGTKKLTRDSKPRLSLQRD
ncbi:MAG: hypothetical protein CMB45_06310 [Euryarchaeota archaeon]|nr:hypothetical protein [Euryarchaeota archaeon]|tara:strand:+ start:443 stop:1288 length:846 start_codon:yes stop_codon:yes gene_type:complete